MLGAECPKSVSVEDPDLPVDVEVAASSLSLDVGQVAQLEATVTNATDPGVTWSSNGGDIATVDPDGTVTAVSPGVATVTARSTEDPNAVAAAAVLVHDVTVEISAASLALQPGETAALTCTLRSSATGAVITGHTFDWSRSAPQVAQVAADGTVTAVADGTADVSCNVLLGDSDLEATAAVTVASPSAGSCNEFGLRLDFDPVQVAQGGSDVLAVFVDRVGAFAGTVELMLAAGAGGTQPFEVMSSAVFNPGMVQFQADENADDTLSAILYFSVSSDVTPRAEYDLSIVGGSPLLETDPDWCRLPVTFEVVG